MNPSRLSPVLLIFGLTATPCAGRSAEVVGKTMTETQVRTASADLYTDILKRACRNGWRYPKNRIENGFNRHFEEMKLQLTSQGYTIVTDATSRLQQMSFAVRNLPTSERRFGCSRPYWLED